MYKFTTTAKDISKITISNMRDSDLYIDELTELNVVSLKIEWELFFSVETYGLIAPSAKVKSVEFEIERLELEGAAPDYTTIQNQAIEKILDFEINTESFDDNISDMDSLSITDIDIDYGMHTIYIS